MVKRVMGCLKAGPVVGLPIGEHHCRGVLGYTSIDTLGDAGITEASSRFDEWTCREQRRLTNRSKDVFSLLDRGGSKFELTGTDVGDRQVVQTKGQQAE
jgi:hypothetical protein